MKVTYDASTDVLLIVFSEAPITDSSDQSPGMMLYRAEDGSIMAMEIFNASKRVNNPWGVEYAVVGL